MTKVKHDTAVPTLTPEAAAEQAIRDAEQAVEALKAERDGLPQAFRSAMLARNADAAKAVRRRQQEIDVDVVLGEVATLEARIARVELDLPAQRAAYHAAAAVLEDRNAEVDRLKAAKASRLDLEHALLDEQDANRSAVRARGVLSVTIGRVDSLRAKVDRLIAEATR